ncbi:MAG: hypothetical protein J4F41_04295 [Alphaproteobacteria bacterium]|nr:hypothetical protein [Alphaproteobacteria bacterium]
MDNIMQRFFISSSESTSTDIEHCEKIGSGHYLHSSHAPRLQWTIGTDHYLLLGHVYASVTDATVKSLSSKEDFKNVEGRYVVIKTDDQDNITIWADKYSRRDVYYSQASHVSIASNMTCFDDIDWTENPDQIALAHSLTIYGSRPAKEQTFAKNISRLGLGQSLTITTQHEFTVTSVPMDILPTNNVFGKTELDQYKDMFFDAIKARGSEDGNLVFLSSGWDSTSIAAVLVHVFGKNKVRGLIGKMHYSDNVSGINKFEIEKAEKFAEYFGIDLHHTTFDYTRNTDAILEEAKTILKPHNCNNMTGFNHINLCKKATEISNGNEAVFAGEISDGAHNLGFSQYTTIHHPSSQDFREYSDKMASYLFGPTFLNTLMNKQQDKDPIWTQFKAMNNNLKFEEVQSGDELTLQVLSNFFLRQTRMPLMAAENINILSPEGIKHYLETSENRFLKPMVNDDILNTLYCTYL